MTRKQTLILSIICIALPFIVISCGNNPEKRRVMIPSTNQVIPKISESKYQAANRSYFKIDKSSMAVEYSLSSEAIDFEFKYDPAKEVLSFGTEVYFNSEALEIKKSQSSDGFKKLSEAWQALKKANPKVTEDVRLLRGSELDNTKFKVVCQETRGGQLEAIYERPKDESASFAEAGVANQFSSHTRAKYVVQMTMDSERGDQGHQSLLNEDSVFVDYLENPIVAERIQNKCAETLQYNQGFSEFFGSLQSSYSYQGPLRFNLPLDRFDNNVFQISGVGESDSLEHIDKMIFSVNEFQVPLSAITAMVGGKFRSGRWESVFSAESGQHENKKSFDKDNLSLHFDFSGMQFSLGNESGSQACKIQLEGKILKSYFSTRRPVVYKNTSTVEVKLSTAKVSDDCSENWKLLSDVEDLQIYVAAGRDEGVILVHLLDNNQKMEILSNKSFIR